MTVVITASTTEAPRIVRQAGGALRRVTLCGELACTYEHGSTGLIPDIRVRRVYDEPAPEDGARILVDRIWPRGLRKDEAHLDEWVKDVAPSTELRTWYGHEPAKFDEFRRRYARELAASAPRAALGRLRVLASAGPLTLLTATKDVGLSQAAILAQLLQSGSEKDAPDNRLPGGGLGEQIADCARFPAEELAEQGVGTGEAALLCRLVHAENEARHARWMGSARRLRPREPRSVPAHAYRDANA